MELQLAQFTSHEILVEGIIIPLFIRCGRMTVKEKLVLLTKILVA